MKKQITSVLLIMMLFVSTFTTFSFAGSTKTMTVYSQVVKSGNTVFVVAHNDLYKINLKKRTVKFVMNGDKLGMMRLHRGYLYFVAENTVYSDDDYASENLYRINVKKGKPKKLYSTRNFYDYHDTPFHFKYALTRTRIYYNDKDGAKLLKKSMKLNGKNKKSSKIKVVNKTKKSNAKGYYVEAEDCLDLGSEDGYITYYLRKPGKDIKIVTYTWDDLYYEDYNS